MLTSVTSRIPVSKKLLRLALGAVVLAAVAGAVGFGLWWSQPPLLEIDHAPVLFTRRGGDLSANLCGRAFRYADLRYQVNGGDWQPLVQEDPRAPKPWWTVELLGQELRTGVNEVVLEASALGRSTRRETLVFDYDDTPVELPLTQDWSGALDVQDGQWETLEVDGARHVRPVPGTEYYDRMILATGAFAGGRRVETEVTFRSFRPWETWCGFGVITMWGGHHDQGHRPRRGWRYAIAWYMKPYGMWCEFSDKAADGQRHDAFAGETWPEPEPGSRWSLIAECWPELDAQGNHLRHRQRMKLWPAGTPEPTAWLSVAERGDARVPPGEYAVALVAHECQAEFGPVRVQALPARTVTQ